MKWCPTNLYRTLRDAVEKRDGLVCRWCGCAVRRSDGSDRPDNATLDHIIPRRSGGPDAVENLVMSCYRCNQRRGRQSASPPITEEQLIALMR